MKLSAVIPVIVKSEMNLRQHWRARKKRFDAQRGAVRLMLQAALWKAATTLPVLGGPPYAVTLVRLGRRRLDSDNLAGAFKAVRDEVAALLGVDDGDEARVTWIYRQEPVTTARDEGIRIEIATAVQEAA